MLRPGRTMQKIFIDLQTAVEDTADIPSLDKLLVWARAAFEGAGYQEDCSLSARFVTNEEIHELNATYRNVDRPTNILSFPYDEPDELGSLDPQLRAQLEAGAEAGDDEDSAKADAAATCCDEYEDETEGTYLGDLVISMEVLKKEAAEQEKSLDEHAAHLIIHGCLHLLGFDHIEDEEAEEMESLEIKILAGLGYANPYLEAHERKH